MTSIQRNIKNLNRKNIVIFCQSPSDVKYLLSVYSEYKGSQISIFVINVRSVFDFLVSLNLNVLELKFIKYKFVNFKNPFSIIREKIRINKLKTYYFKKYNNVNVFFFSRFEDWLTASFILYFESRSESIFYLNHYDDAISNSNIVVSNPRYSRIILGFILKYITGVNFLMTRVFRYPEFPVSYYKIIEQKPIVDPIVFKQYSVTFKFEKVFKKKVLFFISPPDQLMYDIDYYNELSMDIINILINSGYKVFIKGHPRVGLPIFLQTAILCELGIEVLPQGIPGEFIDFSYFDLCLGIDSTILPILAEKQFVDVLCFINLFKSNENGLFDEIKEYLLHLSPKLLKYINTMEEFKLFLNEKENV